MRNSQGYSSGKSGSSITASTPSGFGRGSIATMEPYKTLLFEREAFENKAYFGDVEKRRL
jgi:hypothetical protein